VRDDFDAFALAVLARTSPRRNPARIDEPRATGLVASTVAIAESL